MVFAQEPGRIGGGAPRVALMIVGGQGVSGPWGRGPLSFCPWLGWCLLPLWLPLPGIGA